MRKIPKSVYTAEFKVQAIEHAKLNGRSATAKALNLRPQTLANWIRASEHGQTPAKEARPLTPEQVELSQLRAENARLKLHNEILKKATAYFAKDAL